MIEKQTVDRGSHHAAHIIEHGLGESRGRVRGIIWSVRQVAVFSAFDVLTFSIPQYRE